jgi:branched-chain amino acid transport system ATP-binding protein
VAQDTNGVILEVDGVVKRFGGLTAVDEVSFTVRRGQVLGIIGPNGSGKTTLFNVVSGFLKGDGGRVMLKGHEITGKPSYAIVADGLARTFQIAQPMTHMTVRETLQLAAAGPRARGAARDVGTDAFIDNIAEELGLTEHLDRVTEDLNLGQLRLADIGRAMATRPDVLLLDEPFSGLSLHEMEVVSQAIRDLLEAGMTIVMVEHKLPSLMRLVDEVMVLNFGRKIAQGLPNEIVDNEEVIKAYLGSKAVEMFDNGTS